MSIIGLACSTNEGDPEFMLGRFLRGSPCCPNQSKSALAMAFASDSESRRESVKVLRTKSKEHACSCFESWYSDFTQCTWRSCVSANDETMRYPVLPLGTTGGETQCKVVADEESSRKVTNRTTDDES